MAQSPEFSALQAIVVDLQRRFAEAHLGPAPIEEAKDEVCIYNDPKEVDLNLFKSAINIFSGDYQEYRNWRRLAITLMNNVKQFRGQNIYTEALILIRGKITGKAAQILINNNTKLNFDEIIDRLDNSYADQRPLYVLEEDIMNIRQENKPLHVYFDHLNQALNTVLSKIEMQHKNENVINALSQEIQLKAVRTFIAGLRSAATKNALYSRACTNIMEAYGIARTMQHDSQYHQLEYIPRVSQMRQPMMQGYQQLQQYQQQRQPPVEPMDVDSSGRFRRHAQHTQRNQQQEYPQRQLPPQQRPNHPFRQVVQNFGQQFKRSRDETSLAPQSKAQRVNQIKEGEDEDAGSLYNEVSSVNYTSNKQKHFFIRHHGLPTLRRTAPDGRYVYILIDTGATSSYVSKDYPFAERIRLDKPIKFNTLHGTSVVTHKREINLVGFDLDFYETADLKEFDILLGGDALRKMKARIDLFDYSATFEQENTLQNRNQERINYTIGNKTYEKEIHELMKNNYNNEILPFTTTIQAEIRTETQEPVWVRQYPYSYADQDFVKQEIEKLLNNNIIKESKSPYNSPIWTVSKKGLDEEGKSKKRMVTDFQKLNKQTIADRYPIPDITMTLQNLGKARYFTTLDLESEFHQILIKPEDREKNSLLGKWS
ncbi:uncharacterized protein LOC125777749 [Bactrocera dorsalis]|uniref:Uncharacterized protein LOC125777749 n=1 Tax=Bactrocera dorsalis TaxID=27457 RepID=A0ABM3JIV5_BACDO|nr:uncharacterized protein LOC125777749 [Bactrocera dorsalis]